MMKSDAGDDRKSSSPDDGDRPNDTAPEIAADDAGASAMAERKGKEAAKQAQAKP
jgi:hypothetical protein